MVVDPKMVAVLPDRPTHHRHPDRAYNESFGFDHSSSKAKARIEAREQSHESTTEEDNGIRS